MKITAINLSMLEYPSTYDDDEMNTGYFKSTHFESKIKNLAKETRFGQRSTRNLVSRGQNIRLKYS